MWSFPPVERLRFGEPKRGHYHPALLLCPVQGPTTLSGTKQWEQSPGEPAGGKLTQQSVSGEDFIDSLKPAGMESPYAEDKRVCLWDRPALHSEGCGRHVPSPGPLWLSLAQGRHQHILVGLEEFGMGLYLCEAALEECFAHMNYLMLTKLLISFRHWPLYYYGLDNFIKFSPSLFISQNGLTICRYFKVAILAPWSLPDLAARHACVWNACFPSPFHHKVANLILHNTIW